MKSYKSAFGALRNPSSDAFQSDSLENFKLSLPCITAKVAPSIVDSLIDRKVPAKRLGLDSGYESHELEEDSVEHDWISISQLDFSSLSRPMNCWESLYFGRDVTSRKFLSFESFETFDKVYKR